MIKTNELRLGNLFQDKFSKDYFKVLELTEGAVVFDYFTDKVWQAEPIELTEEILSKIKGSISIVRLLDTEIDLGLLYWFSSLPKTVFIDTNGFENIKISCDYLHQLQNLYFALTNKELEIKL